MTPQTNTPRERIAWALAHARGRRIPTPAQRRDADTVLAALGVDRLTVTGDQMQSAASRVLEWARKMPEAGAMPYEVQMACLELDSAIDHWTAARTATPESENADA